MRKIRPNQAFRNHPLTKKGESSRREAFLFNVEKKRDLSKYKEVDIKRHSNAPDEVFIVKRIKFTIKELILNLIISSILDYLLYLVFNFFEYSFELNHFLVISLIFLSSTILNRIYISLRYDNKRFSLIYKTEIILSDEGILIQKLFFHWDEIDFVELTKKNNLTNTKHYLSINQNQNIFDFNINGLIYNLNEFNYLLSAYKNRHNNIVMDVNKFFERRYLSFKYSSNKSYILSKIVIPD